MKALIHPTVNLNGTSRETLVANLVGVIDALRQVDVAMSLAAPHGRDYQNSQINGENMSQAAVDAWRERRTLLIEMGREIERLAEAIQNPSLPRMIGSKLWPVLEVLHDNNNAEVIKRTGLEPAAASMTAEIVLCYLPHNTDTPLVTWQRNVDDGGCYWGHYYTDIGEAIVDFDERSTRIRA